jgi:hypothetical protein
MVSFERKCKSTFPSRYTTLHLYHQGVNYLVFIHTPEQMLFFIFILAILIDL